MDTPIQSDMAAALHLVKLRGKVIRVMVEDDAEAVAGEA